MPSSSYKALIFRLLSLECGGGKLNGETIMKLSKRK